MVPRLEAPMRLICINAGWPAGLMICALGGMAMDDASFGPREVSRDTAARRLFGQRPTVDRAAEAAARITRRAAETASHQAQIAADFSARKIRTFPVTSAVVALTAGFLLGAWLSPRKWVGKADPNQGTDRHAVP